MAIIQKCEVSKCDNFVDQRKSRCGSLAKPPNRQVDVGCGKDFCVHHLKDVPIMDATYNLCVVCEMKLGRKHSLN